MGALAPILFWRPGARAWPRTTAPQQPNELHDDQHEVTPPPILSLALLACDPCMAEQPARRILFISKSSIFENRVIARMVGKSSNAESVLDSIANTKGKRGLTLNKQANRELNNIMVLFKRILTVVSCLIFVSCSCYGAEPIKGEPINLRVVWTENPQTQAAVLWDSVGGGEGTLVIREGEKTETLQASVSNYSSYIHPKSKKYAGKGPFLTHCYLVRLKDLKPSTKYVLTASVGNKSTKEHYFVTAPDKDIDFKIFFAGDSRTHLDKACAVSRMIKEAFEKDPSYLALLHGGDYAASGQTFEWTAWLAAYSLTTTSDGRLLPIIPVRGNHEGQGTGGISSQAYGLPTMDGKNHKLTFTCMLSPHVGLIVLWGTNKDYLTEELAKFDAQKVRFRMTAYHEPIYPAIKGPNPAKAVWAPLFEKYNIDLGLESDGHCIKRTVPIRGEKKADDGVVYLGEGGYGAPQKQYKGGRWYLEKPGYASHGDHYMSLSFTKSAIEYYTKHLNHGFVDKASFAAKPR